jgi:hypothetical protein
VSTGFAFDCAGKLSRQLDIVIFDACVCPRFEIPGGKCLFPCEAIVAAGEVKTSVTSRHEFREAIQSLVSVKELDRSANGKAIDSRSGAPLSPHRNHLDQVFTLLFITGDAASPDTLAETLLEDAFEIPVVHLPNLVLALDRYLICYCCDSGVCANPNEARGVAVQSTETPSDALLRFYLMLGQALNTIRVSSLPYYEYLSHYHDIPAKVFSSCVEEPPPHLGRWSEGG